MEPTKEEVTQPTPAEEKKEKLATDDEKDEVVDGEYLKPNWD
jgi:hypothetical protein